jgi:broad specificity phosphatase PhoE
MIYVIRHGQTDLNQSGLLQGRSNYPLNEEGILQAEKAAAWFLENGITFDYVFAGPLIRAFETGKIVSGRKPVTDERLTEMDYGPYEGADLKSPPPEILAFFRDFVNVPAPEGMEQLSEVTTRTGLFLKDIQDLQGNILIATHAIAMKGILENLDPSAKGRYWSEYIGNCAVYGAENNNGRIGIPVQLYTGK